MRYLAIFTALFASVVGIITIARSRKQNNNHSDCESEIPVSFEDDTSAEEVPSATYKDENLEFGIFACPKCGAGNRGPMGKILTCGNPSCKNKFKAGR